MRKGSVYPGTPFFRLGGSGPQHQNYDQRRVDVFAQHGPSPSEVANFIIDFAGLLVLRKVRRDPPRLVRFDSNQSSD